MAEGKFVISAQNKIKDGLDAAKKDLLGFEDAAKKVGDTLKTALTVTAIAAGLKKLGDAAFSAYQAFGVMDRYAKQLSIALGGNEASVIKNTNVIEKLTRETLSSKDSIKFLVAELAALGKTDEEIEKIATAAVTLSNVTGKDLNASFTLINATYAGTVGRLNQLLPEISNLTKEQLAAGGATDLINSRFQELSEKLAADNIPQQLKNIADNWGDLKEAFGQAIAPIFSPFLDGIDQIITGWNNAIKAAQIHKQLLQNASFEVKISLNEQLLSMNESRLKELSKMMAPLEKSMGGNTAYLRTNQQYMAWQAERTEIEAENAQIRTDIAEIRAQLKADPSLATGGRVPTVSTGSGTKDEKDPWAKWNPITSGPMSAAGYSFGRQEWEQFGSNKPIDESKFAPIASGPMSAAGYAFDREYWKQFGESPKYTEEQLQTMFAPIITGMYSAAGYKFNKEQWEQFGKIPADTDKALDKNFAPVVTGMYSAAGYKFNKAFWDEFKDLPKYTNDQLDAMFAPVMSGMYSAAGYKTDKALWVEFGGLPKYTDEQLDELFKPAREGMYSAAGYKLAKQEWEEFGNLPKYTNEELDKKFAPVADGMYSAAGYKLAKEEWEQFGNLPKYTNDQLDKMFAPVTTGMYSAAGYKLDRAFWDEFGNLPKYTDEQLQKMFEPVKTGMYSAAGYRLGKQEWEQFGKPQTFAITPTAFDAEGADALSQFVNWPELSTAQDAVVDGLIGLEDAFDLASIGMGDFSMSLLGPVSELMSALGPIANMIAGMNPLLAVLIPVIEGFVSVIAPATSAVLKPLFDTLANIGVVLGQALLPTFDALAPIINMLAIILQATLIPVIQLLAPFIQIIALMIQPLGPAMGALAKAIIVLMAPVQWLADLFTWVGEVLKTFAWNIAHPFRQQSGPGAFTSDAFSGLGARLDAIDALMVNSQSLQNGTNPVFDASASTASQSASYRTQQITINIYQQAPVVGSGGMAEFVQMIRGQFAELAYYGA